MSLEQRRAKFSQHVPLSFETWERRLLESVQHSNLGLNIILRCPFAAGKQMMLTLREVVVVVVYVVYNVVIVVVFVIVAVVLT